MSNPSSSLAINGYHVLIVGDAGGASSVAVKEFLVNGCNVTLLDRYPAAAAKEMLSLTSGQDEHFLHTQVDLSSEVSVQKAIATAAAKFGTPSILIASWAANQDNTRRPIWELGADSSSSSGTYYTSIKEPLIAVKQFLLSLKRHQESTDQELKNVAIVVVESQIITSKPEGHASHDAEQIVLLQSFVRAVQNDTIRLNSKARVNAVVSAAATEEKKRRVEPAEVARALLYLSNHQDAGHISGQCLDVANLTERRSISQGQQPIELGIHGLKSPARKRRMRICLSVDFDGLSGYLGTGHDPQNTLADYSAGVLSANVGVGRLLRLFSKWGISDKVTWFTPCHSLETFPEAAQQIIQSGAEIGLHGYSHEGAYSMTVDQEKDVLEKCIEIVTKLQGGKRPVGYRAPLYQIRETTVRLLQEHGFLYDSSMNAHDGLPYFLKNPFPLDTPHVPDYSQNASTWMKPTPIPAQPVRGSAEAEKALVEIPASWYSEDMTPLGFYPYSLNTQGYVSVDVVEKMWWDRFDWLWENECWLDEGLTQGFGGVFPMVWHPESAGRAHIVGMIDRFVAKLVARAKVAGDSEITFETFESVARSWKTAAK